MAQKNVGKPFQGINRLEAYRDIFHALTDGPLGNYEDFNGDIEDVEYWSRG